MFTLDFLNQVANGLEKDSMSVMLALSRSLYTHTHIHTLTIII